MLEQTQNSQINEWFAFSLQKPIFECGFSRQRSSQLGVIQSSVCSSPYFVLLRINFYMYAVFGRTNSQRVCKPERKINENPKRSERQRVKSNILHKATLARDAVTIDLVWGIEVPYRFLFLEQGCSVACSISITKSDHFDKFKLAVDVKNWPTVC